MAVCKALAVPAISHEISDDEACPIPAGHDATGWPVLWWDGAKGYGGGMCVRGFGTMRAILSANLIAMLAITAAAGGSAHVVTLYRSSAIDSTMRLHIATFDADEGAAYNSENCQIAAQLFQGQPGVTVRYWCESGPYRQSWE